MYCNVNSGFYRAFQDLLCCQHGQLTLCGGYRNHTSGQVANLFNKVIFCIQGHAVMLVQVYANPLIGKLITTRRVLSETKAIMSPTVCHWMESNFFVEEG